VARVGAEMVNPVTGERFVWRHTAESTGGEFAEFDLYLSVGAVVAAPHVHPHQREDFTVNSGTVILSLGHADEQIAAGEKRSVPTNVAHRWRHVGDQEAHLVVRLTPALGIEHYFETFCGLARDGKAAKNGLPRNPLQLAVLGNAFREEITFPPPAQIGAGPLMAALAVVGRRLGLQSQYPAYSDH
jgi:quercetin dioxygenase-like cupin family protein